MDENVSLMDEEKNKRNKPTLSSTSLCKFYLFLRYVAKPT